MGPRGTRALAALGGALLGFGIAVLVAPGADAEVERLAKGLREKAVEAARAHGDEVARWKRDMIAAAQDVDRRLREGGTDVAKRLEEIVTAGGAEWAAVTDAKGEPIATANGAEDADAVALDARHWTTRARTEFEPVRGRRGEITHGRTINWLGEDWPVFWAGLFADFGVGIPLARAGGGAVLLAARRSRLTEMRERMGVAAALARVEDDGAAAWFRFTGDPDNIAWIWQGNSGIRMPAASAIEEFVLPDGTGCAVVVAYYDTHMAAYRWKRLPGFLIWASALALCAAIGERLWRRRRASVVRAPLSRIPASEGASDGGDRGGTPTMGA